MAKDQADKKTADIPAPGIGQTIYAYLRVSTDAQDVANQRHGLLEYANEKGLVPVKMIEDSASGKIPWQKRALGALLEKTQDGDIILFAEISRLGRSTLQVLEFLQIAAERGVSVHVTKSRMVMDGSIQSRITATVLGLAAEIERELIATRTKEALARKKAEGVKLGRPTGEAESLKLDAHAEQIRDYLEKKVSMRSIAKILDCSPQTLYNWIERRGIKKS